MLKTVTNFNELQFFDTLKLANGEPLPQASIGFCQQFFAVEDADQIYNELLTNIKWRHDKIKLYGREFFQPRLTAWYGEPGVTYTYSGITMEAQPWTTTLLTIKSQIEAAIHQKFAHNINKNTHPLNQEQIEKITFNSVLLNRYRHGQDSMGWHSDDEPELGKNPVIASVSFGETRRFLMRHRRHKQLPKLEIPLNHGSVLVMAGQTQHYWQHHIPKTAKPMGERINLTFRKICVNYVNK